MNDIEKQIAKLMQEADDIMAKYKTRIDEMKKKPLLMIVEDDEHVVEGLKNMFEDDYRLSVYFNATSALESMKDLAPDAAILDMKLPDMHGFDLLRKVKIINPQLPIIVHTGYPGEYPEKDIRALGTNLYVDKGDPDSVDKLFDFTETAVETYQKFKREIVKTLITTFSHRERCRYTALFNNNEGILLDDASISTLSPRDIVNNRDLLALCYISNDIRMIKGEEQKTICPFHQDVHPIEGNQIYHVDGLSSAPCVYYHTLRFGNIEQAIAKAQGDLDE